jgi:glutathione peroxidase-family protein
MGKNQDPGSGRNIPDPLHNTVRDQFLGKKFYNSFKTGPNFFLQHLKNKVIFNFVKFVATKNGKTTNFFHPFLGPV